MEVSYQLYLLFPLANFVINLFLAVLVLPGERFPAVFVFFVPTFLVLATTTALSLVEPRLRPLR